MLAGREVIITALKFEAMGKGLERKMDRWASYEAVASGRLMRGKDWPVWRIKASLGMPTTTVLLIQDSNLIVDDGPDNSEVRTLIKALTNDTASIRIEAAEDLGRIRSSRRGCHGSARRGISRS
jgi:hypothetical protein